MILGGGIPGSLSFMMAADGAVVAYPSGPTCRGGSPHALSSRQSTKKCDRDLKRIWLLSRGRSYDVTANGSNQVERLTAFAANGPDRRIGDQRKTVLLSATQTLDVELKGARASHRNVSTHIGSRNRHATPHLLQFMTCGAILIPNAPRRVAGICNSLALFSKRQGAIKDIRGYHIALSGLSRLTECRRVATKSGRFVLKQGLAGSP
jgi:hypothetical protein